MKTIVITGGSKGLGEALTYAFAKEGHNVAICSRSEEALQLVKEKAEKLGGNILAIKADVSTAHEVEMFISLTEEKFGQIDVLINNAAILGPSPIPLLLDFPINAFQDVWKNNVLNPFLVTKRVLPGMILRNEGSVINITSEAGSTGYAGWGAYGISKFAVEGMTETWADELAETSIRINMVDPGSMNTEMQALAVPDRDYEIPKPEQILDVFFFLASEASKNITGQRFVAQEFKIEKEGL